MPQQRGGGGSTGAGGGRTEGIKTTPGGTRGTVGSMRGTPGATAAIARSSIEEPQHGIHYPSSGSRTSTPNSPHSQSHSPGYYNTPMGVYSPAPAQGFSSSRSARHRDCMRTAMDSYNIGAPPPSPVHGLRPARSRATGEKGMQKTHQEKCLAKESKKSKKVSQVNTPKKCEHVNTPVKSTPFSTPQKSAQVNTPKKIAQVSTPKKCIPHATKDITNGKEVATKPKDVTIGKEGVPKNKEGTIKHKDGTGGKDISHKGKHDKRDKAKPIKAHSTGCFGCISRKGAVKGTPNTTPVPTPGHIEDPSCVTFPPVNPCSEVAAMTSSSSSPSPPPATNCATVASSPNSSGLVYTSSVSTAMPALTCRHHTSHHNSKGHVRGDSGDELEGTSGRMPEDNSNNTPTQAIKHMAEYKQLITEMRAQNFDVIRFATYRTACKLRFIQRKTNLFLVDIWNVIEAFRENGLNSLDPASEVNAPRLESLLNSIYYHLNKRLPTTSQISAESSVSILLHWLMAAYDQESHGRIRVLSVKVALATLCSGKLMDKLRYVFTQISDSSGYLIREKFVEYLRECLQLPTAVFEGPSFGYNDTAARACFDGKTKVNVNDFLDTLMSDPGPQCLMWLPILHRMAQVENVFHPVQCEGCHRESFMGFRYKCQRCYNYHLCQDCFWRGRISGNHTNEHDMKEYSSYKSPAKQFSHSLRKSFRCVPTKGNNRIPQFPDTPEKTIDLSHIVPPTPVPVHNGFHDTSRSHSIDLSSMDSSSATKRVYATVTPGSTLDRSTINRSTLSSSCSPSKLHGSVDSNRIDDEHRLIARYAARLAADANDAVQTQSPVNSLPHQLPQARSPTELNFSLDSNKAQRELLHQLEQKNREILREIQRLRQEQEQQAKTQSETQARNPTLLAELRLLRQRRDELEARMSALQESRRELMVQLEGLMKLLKTHGSPRSTPNSSPRSRSAHSPPLPAMRSTQPSTTGDSLMGMGGDVRQAFSQQSTNQSQGGSMTGSVHSLRNDLLVAADSVTNAMSSLVKELNSEASGSSEEEEDDDDAFRPSIKSNVDLPEDEAALAELNAWREEMQMRLQQEQEFIAQLRARRPSARKRGSMGSSNGDYMGSEGEGEQSYGGLDNENIMTTSMDNDSYVKTDDESYMRTDEEDAELYDQDPKELNPARYMTDEESYLETDQESYIRTDDEEGGTSEWEEAMRRWVNR